MYNNILDVKGLKVGQVEDRNGLTGCTVVICEEGAVCGVDVRGGGPGTRENRSIKSYKYDSKSTCSGFIWWFSFWTRIYMWCK